jgi:hypothetical protein
MALGKRKREEQSGWVATTDLPVSPGHPFYGRMSHFKPHPAPQYARDKLTP